MVIYSGQFLNIPHRGRARHHLKKFCRKHEILVLWETAQVFTCKSLLRGGGIEGKVTGEFYIQNCNTPHDLCKPAWSVWHFLKNLGAASALQTKQLIILCGAWQLLPKRKAWLLSLFVEHCFHNLPSHGLPCSFPLPNNYVGKKCSPLPLCFGGHG